MYDFAQHGLLNSRKAFDLSEYMQEMPTVEKAKKAIKKEKEKPTISPKELFNMQALNDKKFQINIDEEYLNSQIDIAKEKLELLGKAKKSKKSEVIFIGDSGAVNYGRQELESIVERLGNRKKIKNGLYKKVLEEYHHTTSKLINQVINDHSNLRCETASQFVPDFPSAAIKAMKDYDKMCTDLCGKKGVYYVIADRKDFEKVPSKRDPILLAQSPFGFFWQILGAWDDEMVYLGDL